MKVAATRYLPLYVRLGRAIIGFVVLSGVLVVAAPSVTLVIPSRLLAVALSVSFFCVYAYGVYAGQALEKAK